MDNLITISSFAEQTGIPLATVRHWRAHGKGPLWFRLGRKLYTTPADVDAWIAEHRAAELATK